MGPDDEICYCYHVSFRKLYNFARRSHLHRPSQMSECLGAGTGCGWCIPILKRIFDSAGKGLSQDLIVQMTPEQYADARRQYIDSQDPRHTFD
jgi:bacterioferritin-associated ferredoxin